MTLKPTILVFDWGNTVMTDFDLPGPMYLWDRIEWEPGAKSALRRLSSDYPCCIASNAPQSGTGDMMRALNSVRADRFFTWFLTSRELGVEKPDPRFFHAVCDVLNAGPGQCIHIGDHYEKDIAAAKDAGLRTVFYNRNRLKGSFRKADAVVTSLYQLAETVYEL
jgi:HAD superfamily hydrolase (TIGR01549 family)